MADEKTSKTRIIKANDWISMNGADLLQRLSHRYSKQDEDSQAESSKMSELRRRAGNNLTLIQGPDGEILGRACITVGYARSAITSREMDIAGTVTVGGLSACTLSGICGILVGKSSDASRNRAIPSVSPESLKAWAEEQVKLIPNIWPDAATQAACAEYVRLCGGSTGRLPIAKHRGAWVNAEQIAAFAASAETIVLADHIDLYQINDPGEKNSYVLSLNDNVMITATSGIPGLLQSRHEDRWPPHLASLDSNVDYSFQFLPLGGAIAEIVAHAWDMSISALLESMSRSKAKTMSIGTVNGSDFLARCSVLHRMRNTTSKPS